MNGLRKAKVRSRNSLVHKATESIRDYIWSQNLKAGDRLPGEWEIAKNLQISRPALREAMSRLECLGLVEVRRGSGTFVADCDHLGTCVDFVRQRVGNFTARSAAVC